MAGFAFPKQRPGLLNDCVVRDKHKSGVSSALPVCIYFSFQLFLGLFFNLKVLSSNLNLSMWKSELWNKAAVLQWKDLGLQAQKTRFSTE